LLIIIRGLSILEMMLTLLKTLFPPLLSLAILILGNGLLNTFVPVRLEMEGYSATLIGIVVSSLYLGILIGSLRTTRWISKIGHIKAFIVFTAILASVTYAQSFWIHIGYWSFLRILSGISLGGLFIVIESWLLMQAPPNFRSAILSIYVAIFYASLSLGQLLINLSDPMTIFPFCIITALFVISILPICIVSVSQPPLSEPVRLSTLQLFRLSPLGFIGGVTSGIILATVHGLVPVYAKETGMSLSEIGTFMAILIFGGFSLQWPMGFWADRVNRRYVLNMVNLITALLGILLVQLGPISPTLLLILAWLFGGFSFTVYPLSMAYACEKAKEEQIVALTGGFVLSYGIGAVAGPAIAPIAMQIFGPSGLFYFISLICLILCLFGLKTPAPAILDE